MKVGIWARHIRGDVQIVSALAQEADRLGYESIWFPDRLIMPANLAQRLDANHATQATQLSVRDPAFDYFCYLGYLAGRTERLRLGTAVWQMGLRHPFVAARAIQTLDIVSNGRAEVGVGAGWLSSEYESTGVDFARRGRRLDETIEICQRLWSDDSVQFAGEFYQFGPVIFEPKPVQKPWPRLLAGGEGIASLRRAARLDGWIGRSHTPESVKPLVERLHVLRAETPHVSRDFEFMVRTALEEVHGFSAWEAAGVTRLYLCPWSKGEDPVAGLKRFAARHELAP
jgi:probable F420-dependent oxidoreductase